MFSFKDIVTEVFYHAGKGDEAYTRYADIARELPNYNLNGRSVHCNCDHPYSSNFCKYLSENFATLGLSALFASSTNDNKAYQFNPETNEWQDANGGGRFQDNTSITDKCDIVITNPPFSQIKEFVTYLISKGKDFIIVSPKYLIANAQIFNLYKQGKLNTGYNPINKFSNELEEEGNKPTMWLTTLNTEKRPLVTSHSINDGYQTYEGTNIIHCVSYKDIPCDFDGPMSVPYTFTMYLDRKQFEPIKLMKVNFEGKSKTRMIIKKQ